ncbi:orotate phosphoribosyltransferase [Patescibacteria group bacterium]|nr:orotate phosphoribosyltransferase [Patescibacteria group bacterium]
MPNGKRIAELLINIGAVKLSIDPPFTLTSGIKSPIYCDTRMMYSHPDAREFVVNALTDRVRNLHIEPDVIAGTATAAIGWAALVAYKLNLPFVYVRAKAKGHGTKQMVEGDLPKHKDVVLIEDMFSTAGSAMVSVDALREEGDANVTDVVAIYTHEFPSSLENAQKHSVKLHPLCNLTTLFEVAVEQGRLTADDVGIAADFARDPQNWHANAPVGQ